MALKHQKKIIAVPRLSKYSEHVNDHQLQIIRTFDEKGYLIGTNGVEELEMALEKVKDFKPNVYKSNTKRIINIIDDFIEKVWKIAILSLLFFCVYSKIYTYKNALESWKKCNSFSNRFVP